MRYCDMPFLLFFRKERKTRKSPRKKNLNCDSKTKIGLIVTNKSINNDLEYIYCQRRKKMAYCHKHYGYFLVQACAFDRWVLFAESSSALSGNF